MFDEYLEPPCVKRPVSPAPAIPVLVNSAGIAVESTLMDENMFAPVDNNPFINNDLIERRNRTLVEAARTMLIFSKASMFLWAEAIGTACYT
nr:putative ribonuclease H-like domain-containing protein [Tanacetum cinerariifolium]